MSIRFSKGLRDAIGNAGFKPTMDLGVLEIYSGARPSSSDESEGTATKLLRITVGSAAYTTGTGVNGLEFDPMNDGVISKKSGQVWSGAALASGTAGWFRFYAKAYDTGADSGSTYCRIDGTVGTSGADLNLNSVTITAGATTTIDQFDLTMAESA